MNLSPSKWHWSQWLCNLMLLVFTVARFNTVYLMTELFDYGGGKIGGNIISILIIITMFISHIYCFGIYYNIELSFLLLRLVIPASILGIEMFLVFAIGFIFNLYLKFSNIFVIIGLFTLYVLSLLLCYSQVEFRLVNMDDLGD